MSDSRSACHDDWVQAERERFSCPVCFSYLGGKKWEYWCPQCQQKIPQELYEDINETS
jgi:Zn finger protein HypA/HybF involved in hydrogenase expression